MRSAVRICAGIVTYNPDVERLRENCRAILPQVDHVIVFDNGSRNIEDVRRLLSDDERTTLIVSPTNLGVAGALNRIFELGRHFDWIVTLDQDTVCPPNLVQHLLPHALDSSTGIVCPDVVYRGNEEYQARRSLPAELVDWCITSGAMTLVAAWEATGGFDEALFIDGVDYDFCLRLRDAGLVVRRVNDVTILHELGALTCRRVLGRVLYITNHSGMRRYYQVRNRLYLQRKLRTSACRCFMSMIKEFVKVLVFERNRRVKMDYMLRGVRDGLRARRDGALGANSEGMR